MVCDTRTKLLFTILSALLLPWGTGGCAVMHDLGFRPHDPSLVIPRNNYMPRGARVCPLAPGFYGYYATCWSPWPDEWEGCPPPQAGPGGTDADVFEGLRPDLPTPAPVDSALGYPRPPQLGRKGWGFVPLPPARLTEGNKEVRSPVPIEVGSPPVGDEAGFTPASPTSDNPFQHQRPPSAMDSIGPAPETGWETPPSRQGQLTDSSTESDTLDGSVATWLASAAEDPAEVYVSDWLLYVEEDALDEPTRNSKEYGATQDGHLPGNPDAQSTRDRQPKEPGALEAPKVSLAYPRSLLLVFP